MNRPSQPHTFRSRWYRLGIIGTVLIVGLVLIGLAAGWISTPLASPLLIFLGLSLTAACAWLAIRSLSRAADELELQGQLARVEVDRKDLHNRIEALLQINLLLADIQDEQTLMQSVMRQVAELTGAEGSSYIPLDELGQPLAVVQQGEVPTTAFNRWMGHLTDPDIQDVCRNCKLRKSVMAASCPLQDEELFDRADLYCYPMRRGENVLGMLNLYLPANKTIASDLGYFLEGLLNEVALAVETFRIRSRELETLRELQLVRSPRMDLDALLKGLIDDVQQALEADFAMIWFTTREPSQGEVTYGKGNSQVLGGPVIRSLMQAAGQRQEVISRSCSADDGSLPEGVGSVLVAALVVPETAAVIGAVVLGNEDEKPFYPRQLKVLRTVAEQAALLLERDRLIDELEYHSVIEERARLAREIHDGLAQTLAFLKIQASQMQASLARGDTARLTELLQTSYKTLSAAYLDTRQAIDSLRITPRERIEDWLGQALKNFSDYSSIATRLDIQPGSVMLPAEIQAQIIRVVQEALSNVRKHSNAEHVVVTLRRWNEDVTLEISDDGQGFSPEDVPSISQYGLRGMRERAEMIGADFQIISSPEGGTTVRLRLPVRFEETPV